MNIAFLGLGKMGRAVAGRLLDAGFSLTVWNRSAHAAGELQERGAKVAASPAEAVAGADVCFSMLMDDAAVEGVVLGDGGVLAALPESAIHVSLSTISVALSERLTERHTTRRQRFVAAPVFGRPSVAAEGRLWIVIGGEADAVETVRPLLQAFSRGLTVVSPRPAGAHAMKIGGNFLITAMIESLSAGMVFAESQGLDPALYMETANSALFQSPFYAAYGKLILDPPDPPGGTVALGDKDMGLFREAAHAAGIRTPLADHFAADLSRAIEADMKGADWAGGLYQLARASARP